MSDPICTSDAKLISEILCTATFSCKGHVSRPDYRSHCVSNMLTYVRFCLKSRLDFKNPNRFQQVLCWWRIHGLHLCATYRGGAIAASGQIASENYPQDGIAG